MQLKLTSLALLFVSVSSFYAASALPVSNDGLSSDSQVESQDRITKRTIPGAAEVAAAHESVSEYGRSAVGAAAGGAAGVVTGFVDGSTSGWSRASQQAQGQAAAQG